MKLIQLLVYIGIWAFLLTNCTSSKVYVQKDELDFLKSVDAKNILIKNKDSEKINVRMIHKIKRDPTLLDDDNIEYIKYRNSYSEKFFNGFVNGAIIGISSISFWRLRSNDLEVYQPNNFLMFLSILYYGGAGIGGGLVGGFVGMFNNLDSYVYLSDTDIRSEFDNSVSFGYSFQSVTNNSGISFEYANNFYSGNLLHKLSFYSTSYYSGYYYDTSYLKYSLNYLHNDFSFGVGASYGVTAFSMANFYDGDIYGLSEGLRIEPSIGYLHKTDRTGNTWFNLKAVLPFYKTEQRYNIPTTDEAVDVIRLKDEWFPTFKLEVNYEL
ncbi:MAG: hypothetical protein GQ534_02520 [Candidatus Delongbacteria bacterium]|nr:hypothetical protein [Candidatus Delongbacteria bacterium]